MATSITSPTTSTRSPSPLWSISAITRSRRKMANNAKPTEGWRAAIPLVLLVGGVVLLLASFFLPSSMLGHGGWSTEDAKRYQAASVRLHTLSHTAVHAKPADQPQMRKDLADAQSDYESVDRKSVV